MVRRSHECIRNDGKDGPIIDRSADTSKAALCHACGSKLTLAIALPLGAEPGLGYPATIERLGPAQGGDMLQQQCRAGIAALAVSMLVAVAPAMAEISDGVVK